MSEGEQTGGGTSSLADRLFGKALSQSAAEHLEKAKADLARGATDQASEHLKRTGKALAHSLTHMTSERLSEQENQLYLNLQSRKYRVSEDGFISERMLDPDTENLYRRLSRKAFGQE